jgi:hypothetical protein
MEWQILEKQKTEVFTEKDKQSLDTVSRGFAESISDEKHLIADNILEISRKLQELRIGKSGSTEATLDKKTNKHLYELAMQLYSIKTHYGNKVDNKLLDHENKETLESLLNNYYQNKADYSALFDENEKIMKSINKKVKLLIFLAGLYLSAQLFFLYYGTFVQFSWDITEPITYLVGCSNLLLICLLKYKFKNLSAFDYFRSFFFQKTQFYKKDYTRMLKLKNDLEKLENKLN